MNEPMTVSVVVPAFNAGSTLGATVASVIAQSFQDWELIIVDDGSLDATSAVAAAITDDRVRALRTPHAGVSAARNHGFAETTGEIVTFLDADDRVEADWLASLVRPFAEDPRVGLVSCGLHRSIAGSHDETGLPTVGSGLLRGERCLFLAGAYALRRTVLDDAGGFDEALRLGENTDLGFRVVATLHRTGMRSATVDRPLVWWKFDPIRTDARDLDRLESAEHTLLTYAQELHEMPAIAAGLERIAAVNAARVGCRRRSTAHALRALGRRPRELTSWTTAASAIVPGLDRRWLRPSTVRTPTSVTTSSPRVSVLLLVGNDEHEISDAIESILRQTYADFELVLIDDGSTDETADELQRWETDRRVRIVTHDGRRGMIAALNHGLSLCRGEFVARLDARDRAMPTRLARQVAAFDARPGAVLCATPRVCVSASDGRLRMRVAPTNHAAMAAAMLAGNRIDHSTVMFRRSAVSRLGGYDQAWHPVADYDLWLRLLEAGEFVAVNAVNTSEQARKRTTIDEHRGGRELERARRYVEQLVMDRTVPQASGTYGARDIACAVRTLRRRLRRRGIDTRGLEAQALPIVDAALANRTPLARTLTAVALSPSIVLLGRLTR